MKKPMEFKKKVSMLIMITTSMIFFNALSQQNSINTSSGTLQYQLIYPAPLGPEVPLRNPGIGIEQMGQLESRLNKTEPTRPLSIGPRNSSLNGVAAITYVRPIWWELEPADNVFHWGTLERNINDSWSKGMQFAFGIITHNPTLEGTGRYWQATPDWFRNDVRHVRCTGAGTPAGCTYYLTDFPRGSTFGAGAIYNDIWAPNQADPVYINQQLELIEALRLHFDKPEWAAKIAYIDMRNWGNWGEWHNKTTFIAGTETNWPEPTYAQKKAITDAYLKFEHIPLIANFQNQDMWIYACQQAVIQDKIVGWRTDGTDLTAYRINPALSANPVLANAWKYGPLYGEPTGSAMTVETVIKTNTQLYTWHFSGWNNKFDNSYTSNTSYKDALDDFRAKGGYRLSVYEVEIPENLPRSESFNISVSVKNSGVALLYRRYYSLSVKLTPQEGGADIIIPLTGKLNEIMPNQMKTFTASNQSIELTGNYTISVGITGDPLYTPLPVTLANVNSIKTGSVHWCPVGSMTVTNPTGIDQEVVIPDIESQIKEGARVYNLCGVLVDIIPEGSILTEVNNLVMPNGVYILKGDNWSRLYSHRR
jgi:hypothetical protein